MKNLAHRYRSQLQKRNYVQKAASNTDYWVAFHYRKLHGQYTQHFGDDFCLIIAGDYDKEGDFYVFPFEKIKSFFVEESLARDGNSSSKRWICSVKPQHRFTVWNANEIDATEYYGNEELLSQALKDRQDGFRNRWLRILRGYLQTGTVFQSPKRDAQYAVDTVEDTGAQISRLSANEPAEVTASGFERIYNLLRAQGGILPFDSTVSGTVAIRVAYLQSPDLALSADRSSLVHIRDKEAATKLLCDYLGNLSVNRVGDEPRLYKGSVNLTV